MIRQRAIAPVYRRWAWLLASWWSCVPAAGGELFERQLQPLLARKCGECHGESTVRGGLRLTTAVGLRAGGESGPALVPGQPDESPLYVRVRDGEMPPEGHPPLDESEVAAIATWIREGANFATPEAARPAVTHRHVLPILLLRCVPCHGGRKQEGGLDLRTRDSLLWGGK
ncbi:MAG: c-type cytochrome domain-containing protein, partial [Pirellulaceae bacterium]